MPPAITPLNAIAALKSFVKIHSIIAIIIPTSTFWIGIKLFEINLDFFDTKPKTKVTINVTGGFGIKSHSGIVATGFGITDSDSGKSASFQVQRQGGGYYYITFTGGILTAWEKHDKW